MMLVVLRVQHYDKSICTLFLQLVWSSVQVVGMHLRCCVPRARLALWDLAFTTRVVPVSARLEHFRINADKSAVQQF